MSASTFIATETTTSSRVAPPKDARDLWSTVLSRLQTETVPAHFDTYLRDTQGDTFDAQASVLRVFASNPFHVPWLETRLSPAVHSAVAEVIGAPVRVEFVGQAPPARVASRPRAAAPRPLDTMLEASEPREARPSSRRIEARPSQHLLGSPLNQRYSFDSFVVGKSNQLAHAASLAVADDPGHTYNPLFLYGGVGLGKTHLLHAIGHAVAARDMSVMYVSSETFTNEMIESIRRGRTPDFRAKYRRAHLLLIDDVQFIAGKERTEEELSLTFNAVHEAGGQIVLSSDRPPMAMRILEDRLRSRFEWGLIADIQVPDYETRVAILRSKLGSTLASTVPADVLYFIAEKVQSNIRELEGSLNRLLAYARHLCQPVSVDLAALALKDLVAPEPTSSAPAADAILHAVSRYFGVELHEITGKARHKRVVVPRQVAMYLLREDAHLSTPEVGRLLSRDHTTVLHGTNLIAADIARGGPSQAAVRGVRDVLSSGGARAA